MLYINGRSRDSSVGIMTILGGKGVPFPARAKYFPLLHSVQIGSGANLKWVLDVLSTRGKADGA
jgi:hypothetical protein